MGETEDTTISLPEDGDEPSRRRDKKARNEPAPGGEPTLVGAEQQQLFLWLEELFFSELDLEDKNWPQQIDLCPMSGPRYLRRDSVILSKIYGPGKERKPERPQIVALAHELLFRAQKDCDIQRRSMVYNVLAAHQARATDYYERWILRLEPKGVYAGAGDPRESDDEPLSAEERFANQILKHHERMTELFVVGVEGMMDRQDRLVERTFKRNEHLEDRCDRLVERLETAESSRLERDVRLKWEEVKVQGAGKMLDMGLAVAPPLLNALVGKTILPTNETAESITLRNFFKSLTEAQSAAVIGIYDEKPPHDIIQKGVLSFEQAKLLSDVAGGRVPIEDLFALLPGGAFAVTKEQVAKLATCGLGLDQIAPLQLLFEGLARRQQNQPPLNGNGVKR